MKQFNIKNNSILCLLTAVILLGVYYSTYLLFSGLSKGFEFTDESYYRLSIEQSENLVDELSHFGRLLSFLSSILGQNYFYINLVGILILVFLGSIFICAAHSYLTTKINHHLQKKDLGAALGFITLASTIFIYYGYWWLITPSYNWLALVTTLLVGSGLLLYFSDSSSSDFRKKIIKLLGCSVMVGFGGAIGFLTKPPTAIVLALTSLLWCFFNRKQRLKSYFLLVSLGLSVIFLYIYALLFFHGILNFYFYIVSSLKLTALLEANHSISYITQNAFQSFWSVLSTTLHSYYVNFLIILIFIALISSFIKSAFSEKRLLQFEKFKPFLVNVLFFLSLTNWLIFSLNQYQLPHFLKAPDLYTAPGPVLINAVLVFFLTTLVTKLFIKQNEKSQLLYVKTIKLCVFLGLLTFAYAFGTNNEVVHQMSGAGFYLILSINYMSQWLFLFIKNNGSSHPNESILSSEQRFTQRSGKFLLSYHQISLYLMVVLQLLLCMIHGYNHPYRLIGTIKDQVYPVRLLSNNSLIFVDANTLTYINQLIQIARNSHWQAKTPLMDMTGASPGVLVVLNATILGKAWFPGGYPGSNNYTREVLQQLPKTLLSQSWVLTAPQGKEKLDNSILRKVGLNFPKEYEMVGHLKQAFRQEEQYLWKPKKL